MDVALVVEVGAAVVALAGGGGFVAWRGRARRQRAALATLREVSRATAEVLHAHQQWGRAVRREIHDANAAERARLAASLAPLAGDLGRLLAAAPPGHVLVPGLRLVVRELEARQQALTTTELAATPPATTEPLQNG